MHRRRVDADRPHAVKPLIAVKPFARYEIKMAVRKAAISGLRQSQLVNPNRLFDQ
jgi:hypothetical protein